MPERFGAFLSPAWWDRLVEVIHGDEEIGHVGRWSNLDLALFADDKGGAISVRNGRVVAIMHGEGGLADDAVIMTGSSRAWSEFLKPVPPPRHNDVLAMDRRQDDFAITGARDVFIRNLRFIELVMGKCRDIEVLV